MQLESQSHRGPFVGFLLRTMANKKYLFTCPACAQTKETVVCKGLCSACAQRLAIRLDTPSRRAQTPTTTAAARNSCQSQNCTSLNTSNARTEDHATRGHGVNCAQELLLLARVRNNGTRSRIWLRAPQSGEPSIELSAVTRACTSPQAGMHA